MAPRKQAIILNGTTIKGKAISTIGGTIPPTNHQLAAYH